MEVLRGKFKSLKCLLGILLLSLIAQGYVRQSLDKQPNVGAKFKREMKPGLQWQIQGSGRGVGGAAPPPPFIVRQNWGHTGRKNCFGERPPPSLISGSGWPDPSLIWRSGSASGLNIYFCFILLLTSSSPCHKDQFAVHISLQVVIVLIQVYNWEIRHHSLVCRSRLADILYISKT